MTNGRDTDMAMNSRDILDIDWAGRARRLLEENGVARASDRRIPAWTMPDAPGVREYAMDPDSVAASIILGEGTGSLGKDLAIGLTGGLAGPITEAAGGQSGVLDWIPGAGIVKAGVIAAPRAADILRRVARTKSDDIVDMMKLVAEDVVERFRLADHLPTREEINDAVREVTADMSDNRGIDVIRRISGDMAENTLNRASMAIDEGRVPSFNISIPEKMDVNFQSLDVDPEGYAARRVRGNRTDHLNKKDFFRALPEEEKDAIRAAALEESRGVTAEAVLAGVTDSDNIKKIRNRAYSRTRTGLIDAAYTDSKRAEGWGDLAERVDVSASEDVKAAQRKAYNDALSLAREQGIGGDEARRLATVAAARAKRQAAIKEGGASREAELAQKRNEKKNLRVAFTMLAPDIQAEITREADAARAAAKQRYIDSGLDIKKATAKSADAGNGTRERLTRKFVKELGFKSVNDPRLADYERLGRIPAEHILRAGAAQYPQAAEEALPVAADVTSKYGAILGGARRLLDPAEFPDSEIDDLLRQYGEVPTADREFNREYAEELLRGEGYR